VGAPTGASVGVGVGVGNTNGVAAPASGDPGVSGVAASSSDGPSSSATGSARTRLAIKRLCPTILASPSDYDDGLVALCSRAAHL
jgi:hypothetical protein